MTAPEAVPDAPGYMQVSPWLLLPKQKRREIVQAWLALPETTRPVFPVYRDAMMEKARRPFKTQPKLSGPQTRSRVLAPAAQSLKPAK